jgi:hypothetical protein
MAQKIRDNTALIPLVLFLALAGVVAYSIIKGNKKVVIMKEDVLYVHPVPNTETSKLQ